MNWVLINDEVEFGITIHYVDEGIDTGDIILQKTYQITDSDNYSTLLNKSYEQCPKLLLEAINKIRIMRLKNKTKRSPSNGILLFTKKKRR